MQIIPFLIKWQRFTSRAWQGGLFCWASITARLWAKCFTNILKLEIAPKSCAKIREKTPEMCLPSPSLSPSLGVRSQLHWQSACCTSGRTGVQIFRMDVKCWEGLCLWPQGVRTGGCSRFTETFLINKVERDRGSYLWPRHVQECTNAPGCTCEHSIMYPCTDNKSITFTRLLHS